MPILVTAALSLQLAAGGAGIGVATASADGQICVAIPGSAPAPGSRLTLVQPHERQSVLAATIVGVAPGCGRLERALIAGPYYLARQISAADPEAGDLWIALLGTFETRKRDAGTIVLQLSTAHPHAQVRSCTSSEGLHLTLWLGTPLKSERLWHQYFYLGLDVEPTCDDREIVAGGG